MPSPTYTFSSGQLIESAKINANFLLLNQCVAKTGDTLTGTLNVRALLPTTTGTYDIGSSSLLFENIFGNALKLSDTDDSHTVAIVMGSNITANRTLTITTGDANRTLTLSGNATLNDWFDQSVKQAASPVFANVSVASTGRLYVDGGSNSYFTETSSDTVIGVAGGTEAFRFAPTFFESKLDFIVAATKKLFFDGGSNTYIFESSGDVLDFYVGGNQLTRYTGSSLAVYKQLNMVSADIVLAATYKLFLDGGTDTYIRESSDGVIQFVANTNNVGTIGPFYWHPSDALILDATKRLYFDGGTDTYIFESSGNTLRVVAGGATVATFGGAGVDTVFAGAISATNLSGTNTGDQTNVSGTAASVTNATQNAITSIPNLATVGTITSGTWSGSFGAVSGANLTTLNASNLASGTVDTARIAGSYTGITGVGIIATGTWQGTPINGASYMTGAFGAPSTSFSVDTNYTPTKDTIVMFYSDSSSQLIGRINGVDTAISNNGTGTGVLVVPKGSTWRVVLGGGSFAAITAVTVGA